MTRTLEKWVILIVGMALFLLGIPLAINSQERLHSALLMVVLCLLVFGLRIPKAMRHIDRVGGSPIPHDSTLTAILNVLALLALVLVAIAIVSS